MIRTYLALVRYVPTGYGVRPILFLTNNIGERRARNDESFITNTLISEILQTGDTMKYTRFEKARIVGARALQIALGAPILVDYPESMIDPVDIAMLEYDEEIVPISVNYDTN